MRVEPLVNDLKHALRILRQSPGFTITALTALALGIGANTAIFTVVDTVVLHPLPFPHSDRIVTLSRPRHGAISEPVFAYWERNSTGLDDLAAYHAGANMNLTGGNGPELVKVITASRNYFRLFGASAVLGRTFTSAEDSPGGAHAIVLSYALWRRRFGGDPAILGKTASLGGGLYAVVGVLSQDFRPYPPADLWIPLQADPNSTNLAGVLTVAGRLPGTTTRAEAAARMAVIGKRYVETHAQQLKSDPDIQVAFLEQQITGDIRPALLILLGAVGMVLLIACANVANLLAARAAVREREIAIRAAIGASRGRIVRQLLAESLLLAISGGAIGLLLGSWGVRALLALIPGDLPRLEEMAAIPALDARVAGFTLGLAIATGLLFGLLPAFQLSRADLTLALNAGGRAGSGLRQSRTRGVLVACEAAIAVVLLCGALLLIRSFAALHGVSVGFDSSNVLTMEISLAGHTYSKSSNVDRLARQFVERAERIPGVESAALASALPLWGGMDMIFDIPGRPRPAGRQISGDVQWRFVSPHYFDILRIPLLSGRLFAEREPDRTVLINQTMARRFWPGENPVGQSIFIGPTLGQAYQVGLTQIVGVVGDVRQRMQFDPSPIMYQAPSQIPDADMALLIGHESTGILVRTRPGIAPLSVSRAIESALLAIGKLPVSKIRTMQQAGLDSTARENFNLLLLGLFAALALALAALGIYAVMSSSVEQRVHEIGIRSALGASRPDIARLVLSQALRMTLAGIIAGLAASLGLTRLLTAELYAVTPSDPLTFAVVPCILLAVAIGAASIPALRASRVDPLVALRHE